MTGMIPRFCPHCNGPLDVPRRIEFGGWSYDEEAHTLLPGGEKIHFTPAEGAMVGALLRAAGRPVGRCAGLYAAVCGDRPEVDWPELKIVDVYISKVRGKLRACYGKNVLVATQWGVGYYAVAVGEDPPK